MHYRKGISNKTLKMNTGDVLKKYDKDGNGFDKNEIKEMAKGSVSVFGRPFISNKVVNSIQNVFDKNKDGIVSEKEIDSYLKSNYNIDLNTAKKMKVGDLVDKIYEIDQAKKKNK